jgi:hypothetical protein
VTIELLTCREAVLVPCVIVFIKNSEDTKKKGVLGVSLVRSGRVSGGGVARAVWRRERRSDCSAASV